MNYDKLHNFIDKLPESSRDSFKAIIQEGQLVAKTSLQLALDAVDTAASTIFTAVLMRWESWLHLLGFLKEVWTMVEDLPFKDEALRQEDRCLSL